MHVANDLQKVRISIAGRGEGDNVVDNLCDSVGAVVSGTGIQLYDGWIHPFVAGARIGRSNN